MSRWEPNARERLVEAAMELFQARGYTATTVQEIAERAGLTERTFFRYYADKREVLFWGSGPLQELLVGALAGAPVRAAPMDAVAAALEAAAPIFEERRDFASQRHTLIAANDELRERESIKLASLASAMADALRRRGVRDPAASLAGEVGIAVFKIAFDRWVHDTKGRGLSHHLRASSDELEAVVAGGARAPSPSRMAPARRPRSRGKQRAHK
jgi:AcrR family transcriptional regulator